MISHKLRCELLTNVIDEGLSLMKNKLSLDIFNAWKEYANGVLESITRDNGGQKIYLNFLRLQVHVMQKYDDNNCYAQMSLCLEYLIDMIRFFKN